MKRLLFIISIFTLIVSTSCKKDKKEEPVMDESKEKNASEVKTTEIKKVLLNLEAKSGSSVNGNAVFSQNDNLVTMTVIVEGLSEGTHAIHIHEKADCSSPDGKSTGGHWHPTNQPHGEWGSVAGFHKGDIGNLVANASGKATINMTTSEWCIGCGDVNKDILGKAIIIHEVTNDFKTQPTGDAGGRVSCGGIIQ